MKHELEAGNYSLKFKAIRGNLENQKVLLDNIRVKTSFTQKTDKEIPDTTTTTTTVTYFNPYTMAKMTLIKGSHYFEIK